MNLDEYQSRSQETNQLHEDAFRSAVAAMFGLASESGAILSVYKRFLRDKIDLESHVDYLEEELGDLLWYVATVAAAFDLKLGAVAERNLQRTREFFHQPADGSIAANLPVLDLEFPSWERFPRQLQIHFEEISADQGQPSAFMAISNAHPLDDRWGDRDEQGRMLGFECGEALGDALTDNARRADGYRYHDAIHLGFMAVLGWSPVMRHLLHLKRRSSNVVDESEDGARAIFTEEGLAAILAQLSRRRLGFETETSVDMETIEIARSVTADLECAGAPPWLWRRAIHQGFRVMRQLESHHGGDVIVDLDMHRLTYINMRLEDQMTQGSAAQLASQLAKLHRDKDAAYGNAWKKRGEQMSIMANLARKVDRIENLTQSAGVATLDEDLADTAADLFIYAVKYQAFLADESAVLDQQLFGDEVAGHGKRSGGPHYVNQLIATYGAQPLEGSSDISTLAREVIEDFVVLEQCFSTEARAAVEERFKAARRLSGSAWRYALALELERDPSAADGVPGE